MFINILINILPCFFYLYGFYKTAIFIPYIRAYTAFEINVSNVAIDTYFPSFIISPMH